MLQDLTEQLAQSKHLSNDQVLAAVSQLVLEEVPVATKAEFLAQLAKKGETPEEITSFVTALRDRCVRPELGPDLRSREILDVVGTGGDRLSTFNISTTVAILASASGVLVAKHGNRASTSTVGSADVMEALGLKFDLTPEQAVIALRAHGFAYFFAPRYHPAFRHIVPARKMCAQAGQPTIFNFLGPLLNPACPTAMLIGVPRPSLCEPLARVLQSVGVRRAMVICGAVREGSEPVRYLDEWSPLGPTTVAEFYHQRGLHCSEIPVGNFPLQPASLADLRGGDAAANAQIVRSILRGEDRGPKREAVLLNAAAALFVAGRVKSVTEGWQLGAEVIDSGAAARKLEDLAKSAD